MHNTIPLRRYNELQLTSESRISDLSAQLRVKTFECARVELLLEEAQASLAAANLESQKQREKVAVATQECVTPSMFVSSVVVLVAFS